MLPETVVDTEKSEVASAGAFSVNVNDDPPPTEDNDDSPVPRFVAGVKSETRPVVAVEVPDITVIVHEIRSPTRTGSVASTQERTESDVGRPKTVNAAGLFKRAPPELRAAETRKFVEGDAGAFKVKVNIAPPVAVDKGVIVNPPLESDTAKSVETAEVKMAPLRTVITQVIGTPTRIGVV